jgi:hypothetical protein
VGIFKFLICSILAVGPLPAEGENGWYTVEKSEKVDEQIEDTDPSIWALFVKDLGKEKFQIRFPEEPSYRYLDTGEMIVQAQKEGQVFELTIEKAVTSGITGDRVYQSEGRWVREHVVMGDGHVYKLRSYSDFETDSNHKEFISSFLLQKDF